MGILEQKISERLAQVNCSVRNFTEIAREANVKINRTTLADAVSQKLNLDSIVASELLELTADLLVVQKLVEANSPTKIPIDWADKNRVTDLRLVARYKRFTEEENGAT